MATMSRGKTVIARGTVPHDRRVFEERMQALGEGFDGLLWAFEGNRAFLRSLHAMALCLWREKRVEEAEDLLAAGASSEVILSVAGESCDRIHATHN
jgi:hypothetical protein